VETFLSVGLANAVVAGLLALGVAAVGIGARGRPALRHGLWLLVLLKLVTPPLWKVPVAWVGVGAPGATVVAFETTTPNERGRFSPQEEAGLESEPDPEPPTALVEAPVGVVDPGEHPAGTPFSWAWLLAIWGSGSVLTFGVAAWRIQRFQRFLRLAEPASEATRREVETLAEQFGLGRIPEVWRVPGPVSPMLWALGCRPCLIVPMRLWDRLDGPQRATLLAHELAHLKRRDHWVRCLELLVTGLYWWLPVVWIARYALREAEEQCCDAWVVWAFPDAIRTYADALLETLDFLSGTSPAATVAVAASGIGPVHHWKRRMTMIMQGTTPRALTWSGLLAVLGLSATLLPLSPTWAQRPDPDRDRQEEKSTADPKKPETRSSERVGIAFDPFNVDVDDDDDEDDKPEPKKGESRKPEVRVFKFAPGEDLEELSDEALASQLEKLQDAIAKIKEKLSGRVGEITSEKQREDMEQALQKMQHVLAERLEARRAKVSQRERTARQKEGAEAERSEREAEEREAQVKRLKAQVEERRKALIEAEKQLARAVRQLAERSARDRGVRGEQRFEFRFGPQGEVHPLPKPPTPPALGVAPRAQGRVMIVPRPDQEKRIRELEEKLDKLMDEVKSLKKDAPEKK
jgi:beta-lactamase regulating signal transducer with metallopeptidase domain